MVCHVPSTLFRAIYFSARSIADLNERLVCNTAKKSSPVKSSATPSAAEIAQKKKTDAPSADDKEPETKSDAQSVESGKLRLPMSIFRPNIVINAGGRGTDMAWSEDWMELIQFSSPHAAAAAGAGSSDDHLVCRAMKGCDRCLVPNMDPLSGKLRATNEPMQTLRKYRSVDDAVFFGVLLQPLSGAPDPAPANILDPIVVSANANRSARSLPSYTLCVGDHLTVLAHKKEFIPGTNKLPLLIATQPPDY
jgi:hypothetical protein